MIHSRAARWVRRQWRRAFPAPFDPAAPFGREIRADREVYLRLHAEACENKSPTIEKYLSALSHQVDEAWLTDLALHTQIVVKTSRLNFQHGRILYALLREHLDRYPAMQHCTVFETGTSRGFSIICMAKALNDAGRDGKLVTTDIIRHYQPHLWNCIDDHDGPKTRNEILAPWSAERDRVVFITGDSKVTIPTIGLPRINFSFLDGSHTKPDVLVEFDFVKARQQSGDVIVIDDVTVGKFDGIVEAVEHIKLSGLYSVEHLSSDDERAYAVAVRL